MRRTLLAGGVFISVIGLALPAWAQAPGAVAPQPPQAEAPRAVAPQPPQATTEERLNPELNPIGTHLQQTIDLGLPQVPLTLTIASQRSLLNVGEEPPLTKDAVAAGKLLHEGLETHDDGKIAEARRIWKKLIPIENIGGEYTALDWFASYVLASDRQKRKMIADPLDTQFFDYFGGDDFAVLKEYLRRKYHLQAIGDEFTRRGMNRRRDLDTTMLLNNPHRQTWERSRDLLKKMKVQPGWTIADIGSGSAFYAVTLAKAVGPSGKYYGVEVDDERIRYLDEAATRHGLQNIVSVRSDGPSTRLEGENLDAVMLTGYHNLYAISTAFERNNLMTSIRETLKDGGMFYVIDSGLVGEKAVPYFGPYIAKDLVTGQVQNYGFELVTDYQPVPQRYLLGFRKRESPVEKRNEAALGPSARTDRAARLAEPPAARPVPEPMAPPMGAGPASAAGADRPPPADARSSAVTARGPGSPASMPPPNPSPAGAADSQERPFPEEGINLVPVGTHLQQTVDLGLPSTTETVTIDSQRSLINVGLNDGTTLTEGGVAAGKLLFEGLINHDMEKIRQARAMWKELIPIENYGGEYTALDWFASYILAPEDEKAEILKDPLDKQFFDYYAKDDFAGLKEYTVRKYQFMEIGDEFTREGMDRKGDLELTMLFNNPRREEWENTTRVLQALDIQPGWEIADLGSGAGYYTVKFGKLVGESGKVYGIELDDERIRYVNEAARMHGLNNIVSIKTDGTTTGLDGKTVDMVFMCSLYHNIYSKSSANERNKLMMSIRSSLKPDGTLYIVDNAVVADKALPYHGQYIAKELVKAQVEDFGFKLVREHQPIPQRYILAFKKVPSSVDETH